MKFKIEMLVCSCPMVYRGTFKDVDNAAWKATQLVDQRLCADAKVIDKKGNYYFGVNSQYFNYNGKNFDRRKFYAPGKILKKTIDKG